MSIATFKVKYFSLLMELGKSMEETLKSIKNDVANLYPQPIASVVFKYLQTRDTDLGGRLKNLLDLFESILIFLSVITLQEARANLKNLKERLPEREKTLAFLKHPSDGGWMSLLRALCSLQDETAYLNITKKVTQFIKQPKNSSNKEILADAKDLGVNYEKRSSVPIEEIFNILITFRNKRFAHAANIKDNKAKEKLLSTLEKLLTYLLKTANFLTELEIIHTDQVEINEKEEYVIHGTNLKGIHKEKKELNIGARKCCKNELYLCFLSDSEKTIELIPLGPFMLWMNLPGTSDYESYMYSDSLRTKLEYTSYESGNRYYHRELQKDFEDLISLRLKPLSDEEAFLNLTAEERAYKAEEFFKIATFKRGSGLLEEALEILEQSLAYQRSPETFILIAEIQQELHDPREAVLRMVENALEIEPSSERALQLRYKVNTEESPNKASEIMDITNRWDRPITILDVLCPKRYRHSPIAFWSLFFFFYYSVSALIHFSFGKMNLVAASTLCLVWLLFALIYNFGGACIIRDAYPLLSLQLGNMRPERFKKWYDSYVTMIYGSYVHGDEISFWQTIRKEKIFYIFLAMWTPAGIFAALKVTESLQHSPTFVFNTVWTYTPIIFLFVYGSRYAIITTLLIFNFSRLPIKPVLTKLGVEGMSAFSNILSFFLSISVILIAIWWTVCYLVVTASGFVDFYFLSIISACFLFWSLGVPIVMRVTAAASKKLTAFRYSVTVEEAFTKFLETPDQVNYDRYHWLLKSTNVIKNISTWPLTKSMTLGIITANIFIFLINVWYVLIRLNKWQAFVSYIANLLQ